jgi:hypothetical protein
MSILVIGLTGLVNAQSTYRVASVDLNGNLNVFKSLSSTCGTQNYDCAKGTVVEVIRELDNGAKYVVAIYIKTSSEPSAVNFDTLYCITKADLFDNNYFRPYSKIDHGVLAIPYKMRFAPFSIFPGGTLGYYVGKKINKKNFVNSIVFFGGISTIPLNNINSDIVDVKLGFSAGAGWIWYVEQDFQIGLIGGIDLFDGVDTWTYKYQPWLSFNIGYSFATKK